MPRADPPRPPPPIATLFAWFDAYQDLVVLKLAGRLWREGPPPALRSRFDVSTAAVVGSAELRKIDPTALLDLSGNLRFASGSTWDAAFSVAGRVELAVWREHGRPYLAECVRAIRDELCSEDVRPTFVRTVVSRAKMGAGALGFPGVPFDWGSGDPAEAARLRLGFSEALDANLPTGERAGWVRVAGLRSTDLSANENPLDAGRPFIVPGFRRLAPPADFNGAFRVPAPDEPRGDPGVIEGVWPPAVPELTAPADPVGDDGRALVRRVAGEWLAILLPAEAPRPPPPATPLGETPGRMADHIRANPGCTAADLAQAAGCTEEHARRVFGGKLKPLGFFGVKGGGYHPPAGPST